MEPSFPTLTSEACDWVSELFVTLRWDTACAPEWFGLAMANFPAFSCFLFKHLQWTVPCLHTTRSFHDKWTFRLAFASGGTPPQYSWPAVHWRMGGGLCALGCSWPDLACVFLRDSTDEEAPFGEGSECTHVPELVD